jgi:hypothetical protein
VQEWFDYVVRLMMVPLGVLAVYEATRRWVLLGPSTPRVAVLVFGITVLGLQGLVHAWGSSKVSEALELFGPRPAPVALTRAQWEQFPPQERVSNSRLRAEITFEVNGQLIHHFLDDGQSVLYAPTGSEIERRVRFQSELATLRQEFETLLRQAWSLGVALVVALAVGCVVGALEKQRRTRLKNETDGR